MEEHHWRAFLHSLAQKEQQAILSLLKSQRSWHFSWQAAVLNFFWFFTRKMYFMGFLVLALVQTFDWAMGAIFAAAAMPDKASFGVRVFILALLTGWLGPKVYAWWVHRKVTLLLDKHAADMSNEEILETLQHKGGHSNLAWWVLIGVSVPVFGYLFYAYTQNPELVMNAISQSFAQQFGL